MKRSVVKNNVYAMKLLWKLCKGQVIHRAFIRFLGYFEWIFYSAFFMRYVINALEKKQSVSHIMIFLLVTVIVFASISYYNCYVEGTVNPINGVIINKKLNKLLFHKARNVELSCFEDYDFYNKYTLAMDKADEKLIETVDVIWGVLFGIIATICAFIFIYKVDKLSILFIIFPLIGNFVFNTRISKIDYERNKESTIYNRKIAYINRVMYLTDYAKEMRLSDVFSLMKREYTKAIQGVVKVTKKYTKKSIILHWFYATFTFSYIFEGMLIYGAYRTIVSKTISFAELAVITSMMVSTTWILIGFTQSVMIGYKNGLFINNLRVFLEHKEKIPESYEGDDPGDTIQSIEFENVTFSYKNKRVIKNLSLKIEGGKIYALVGYNGAGKSTIIKLLMRFYDPQSGKIYCNGKDIKSYNLKKYRALFATAFQDCQIFSLSVAENVLMHKVQQGDEEEVINALKSAGAYERVMKMPKGIYTTLTKEFDENGVALSGGEYQKITVARAFAQRTPIKIYDEPSSALDPIAESTLFDNILENRKNSTILFISHRLSSVQSADWIFVLEDGILKEEGSHDTLMSKDGIYSNMYKKQAENYFAIRGAV